ncbi:unnamed protein product [Closterium sp. Naga37s-1]|nr:unnamed protein product [Closterium sp. Naga37s-1]
MAALAVLPLSSVECKSWIRGSLCNARLAELMQISLLQYEMDWPGVLDTWKSLKKIRPAQSVLFPSDDRKRKEKEPEKEEEEPREPAGEEGSFAESDDDRDDNQEMDQEIEQSPPRDYSEEEDNPFLSDDEEGEEMFRIDQPTE